MTSEQSASGTDQLNGSTWVGRGVWLVDRRHYRRSIGVITQVHERDRGMASRLSIEWKSDRYQNISLSMALDNFKRGVWEVDR